MEAFAFIAFAGMAYLLWVEHRLRRETHKLLQQALDLSGALLDFAKTVEAATPEKGDVMPAAPVRQGFLDLERAVGKTK